MSMPDNVNLQIGDRTAEKIMSDDHVHILNGELLTGVCGAKVIGQAQGGLIHILFKDFSPDFCKAFLNNCQRTMT